MPKRLIRYAVVGLGHIAQVAVLPAFGNARRNSRLVGVVSGDPVKREEMRKKYGFERAWDYGEYDRCLGSGEIDAVYIALPNHMHREYAERAARAGVHVLCEKPMALDEADCEAMSAAARVAGVKLMIAYRLHFERANLEAIETARSGRIGQKTRWCAPGAIWWGWRPAWTARCSPRATGAPPVPPSGRARRCSGTAVCWMSWSLQPLIRDARAPPQTSRARPSTPGPVQNQRGPACR